jgi:hypothetical protein
MTSSYCRLFLIRQNNENRAQWFRVAPRSASWQSDDLGGRTVWAVGLFGRSDVLAVHVAAACNAELGRYIACRFR